MKKPSGKDIRAIISIVIGSLVPAFMFYVVYHTITDWVVTFDLMEVLRIVFFVFMSLVSYYGMMNLVKPLLDSFNFYTKNKNYSQNSYDIHISFRIGYFSQDVRFVSCRIRS